MEDVPVEDMVRPATPEELAAALAEAAKKAHKIRLGGAFSKDGMGGPLAKTDICISTCRLSRVAQYEPKDLTISVHAGMRWADLTELLARNGQMVPLDPPFFERATAGGVLAANCSGPRRRLSGTARDLVIGMTFATLEGKLVQSGGMVVKNVAGLDMAKLMIGSFGTLAAIAVVNFKLIPRPPGTRTFTLRFDTPEAAITARSEILKGALSPTALDLLNPAGSERVGLKGYSLLLQASGGQAVLDRYQAEFSRAKTLKDTEEEDLWARVREFVPDFLAEFPGGAVIRVSTTLSGLNGVFRTHHAPALARAASGVSWLCVEDAGKAQAEKGSVIEFAPANTRAEADLWPEPGGAFGLMKKIKDSFDPRGLLNPGRLYGRI